jgi:hypothetical protein
MSLVHILVGIAAPRGNRSPDRQAIVSILQKESEEPVIISNWHIEMLTIEFLTSHSQVPQTVLLLWKTKSISDRAKSQSSCSETRSDDCI